MTYEHNIFWSDIPKDAKIYDLGGSWVVHMPDGRKGVVYWNGESARKAQDMLRMRALPKSAWEKDCANHPASETTHETPKLWSEEDFQKALKTAKGHDRVNLLLVAADQLSNNPIAGCPMYKTSRRIAGLRGAATRLKRKLVSA